MNFSEGSQSKDGDTHDKGLNETDNLSPAVTCHSVLLDDVETRSFSAIGVSFWMQFILLFKKSFICSIRDLVNYFINFLI